VLTTSHGGLVTISAVFAVYFSSSGIESLRIGLNRAYELRERRSFWVLRPESIGFVLLSAIAMSGRLTRMTLPMPMLAPRGLVLGGFLPACLVGQTLLRSRSLLCVLQLAASGIKKPNLERRARLVDKRLVQFGAVSASASGCEGRRHMGRQGNRQHNERCCCDC
jgi:hypothetical protein